MDRRVKPEGAFEILVKLSNGVIDFSCLALSVVETGLIISDIASNTYGCVKDVLDGV